MSLHWAPKDSVAYRNAEVQVTIANKKQLETLLGQIAHDRHMEGRLWTTCR